MYVFLQINTFKILLSFHYSYAQQVNKLYDIYCGLQVFLLFPVLVYVFNVESFNTLFTSIAGREVFFNLLINFKPNGIGKAVF